LEALLFLQNKGAGFPELAAETISKFSIKKSGSINFKRSIEAYLKELV
jgi:hypothetical protein